MARQAITTSYAHSACSVGVPASETLDRPERQHAGERERRYKGRSPGTSSGARGAEIAVESGCGDEAGENQRQDVVLRDGLDHRVRRRR